MQQGTTNSLVSCFAEDGAVIIPNRLGENLTPSVVSIDEETEEIYVGKIAKERMITHPELSAEVFKRSMGTEKKFTLGKKRVSCRRAVIFCSSLIKGRC